MVIEAPDELLRGVLPTGVAPSKKVTVPLGAVLPLELMVRSAPMVSGWPAATGLADVDKSRDVEARED